MIRDVPSSNDFLQSSIGLLNQAWDAVYELSDSVRRPPDGEWDNEQIADYWQTAQPRLRTALALVQQAAEIGLKSKIAAIDPFLLVAASPERWPEPKPGGISFAEFYTVGAKDLPKVHDLFASSALSSEYRTQYERLRRLRNLTMHSIGGTEELTDIRLFEDILIQFRHLGSGNRWAQERLAYQSTGPLASLHSADHAMAFMLLEIDLVVDVLPPNVVKREFGFDKKRGRRYICPRCREETGTRDEFADGFVKFAKLNPNTPTAQSIYCFVCGQTSRVRRVGCVDSDCPGDVIADEHNSCLTCGSSVRRPQLFRKALPPFSSHGR